MILILGAPGVGKSAVTRVLLGVHTYDPVTRWSVGAKYAAAGPYTNATYDGPDSFPLSNAVLIATINRRPVGKICILDGERFASKAMASNRKKAILLVAALDVMTRRRAARGSPAMSPRWYTERIARAEKEASRHEIIAIIDANKPLHDVAHNVDAQIMRHQ